MNKTKLISGILLAIAALIGVSVSVFLFKQNADLSEQLKQQQFRVDVVEEDNQKLASGNDALKRDLDASKEMQQNLVRIKTDLESKLKEVEEKIPALEADLKDAQWKLEQLKTENAVLSKENESLKVQAKDNSEKKTDSHPKKKFFLF